jgi:hypothetical protein
VGVWGFTQRGTARTRAAADGASLSAAAGVAASPAHAHSLAPPSYAPSVVLAAPPPPCSPALASAVLHLSGSLRSQTSQATSSSTSAAPTITMNSNSTATAAALGSELTATPLTATPWTCPANLLVRSPPENLHFAPRKSKRFHHPPGRAWSPVWVPPVRSGTSSLQASPTARRKPPLTTRGAFIVMAGVYADGQPAAAAAAHLGLWHERPRVRAGPS